MCRGLDPEIFYPEDAQQAQAKKVCAICPVKTPCLEYALANGERFGIWGGTSERERRRILRRRLA